MQNPVKNTPTQSPFLRMHFNSPRLIPIPTNNLVMQTPIKKNVFIPSAPSVSLKLVDTSAQLPKMEWGAAIWIFFHTLAFKVHEIEFPKIKEELFNFIRGISSCLPCPKCSEHAKIYLSGVNFKTIVSKRDLILMLYAFHNAVNARKHSPIVTAEEMDLLYVRANTIAVIRYFVSVFRAKNGNLRLLTDDMQRQLITTKFESWFTKNSNAFDN